MKKYLPHLAFLFAVFLLIMSAVYLQRSYSNPYWIYNLAGAVVIFFFLWKNNYFTRNKS
jgi:hypothetical protein|tara:strand:+ start:216 stop:392 length:177 start_codon:yes stop_codon:yes gene_type:complete